MAKVNRKVIYAKLHSSAFLPGIGHLGDTLPSQSKSFVGFDMVKTASDGIEVAITMAGNKKLSAVIPAGNVIIMQLEPDTE